MNPNNQQPYYNYHQHTPGPSQPQWQAPPRQKVGWGDPRVDGTSPISNSPIVPGPPQGYGPGQGQLPIPPPPPPPAGGFPKPSFQDTSAWGVKYNQGQQFGQAQDNALRPALPPRPASGQAGPQIQPAWPGAAQSQEPPVPPPRPAEYAVPHQQTQSHYFPHEQYSNRPTSHQYEPTTQWSGHQSRPSNATPAPAWQNMPPKHDDPVSPMEHHSGWQSSPPTALGASALGSGGPSDWEHFSGEQSHFNETPPVHQQHQQHDQRQQYDQHQEHDQHQQQNHHHQPKYPLPQTTSTPPSYSHPHQPNQPHPQHGGDQSQPFTATPEQGHATPAYTGPGRPSYGNTASPQQQYTIPTQQSMQQSPARHSIATPYYGGAGPPPAAQRQRLGSDASASTASGPQRSGTIDSVIDAWSGPTVTSKVDPLKASVRPTPTIPERVQPSRQVSSIQTQTDFPPITKTETKVVTKVETREIDPYEDLKNEYRTSLNRYATMLRQEKAATSEQEKMGIVAEFVNREVKLRSVMFNAEPAELIRSSELAELRQTVERLKNQSTPAMPPASASANQSVARAQSLAERNPRIQTDMPQPQHSRDDSFVVIGANGEDADYSPGGRPRVTMAAVNRVQGDQRSASPAVRTAPPRNDTPAQRRGPQPHSPGADAPMTLDDYAMPDHPSIGPDRSFNATPQVQRPSSAAPPPAPSPANNAAPISFQPARPAYAPFRYAAAQDQPQPLVSNSNPADLAYTKLRHEQATESGRILSQEPPALTVTAPDRTQSATPSRARQQQEEAFIGLLRQQSRAVKKPARTATSDAPAPLRAGTPMMQRRPSLPPLLKSAESLRQALPDNLAQLNFSNKVHPKIAPIGQSVANLSDDFGFIHATVVAWDRENRKSRQKLDTERATRESESQSHIDAMFHDNEIGYADIAGLEEDFKLEEASKKYEEDQDELDSFTRNVYEKIATRLGGEVTELERLRIQTLDVLDLETESVSHRIQTAIRNPPGAMEKAPLADTMKKMLQIFNKIEVRQQKMAEANFERERRRKRLELSVLYTNGDTPGIKQLEKDFDKAQSMQVLSEARNRDQRANRLMDSFDRAVVRGLAENQEWIDETSSKATLLRDLVLGSASNGPQGQDREELLYGPRGIKESMEMLQDAVGMVLADSRELVQMSAQADALLNEADFAMFLAEAKVANTDEKEFEKLKSEKHKEDQKLKDESDGRMNGVQRGPDEIFGFIKDVKDFIGNDKGHHDRINQALEAAKKRNQSPPGQGEGIGSLREV